MISSITSNPSVAEILSQFWSLEFVFDPSIRNRRFLRKSCLLENSVPHWADVSLHRSTIPHSHFLSLAIAWSENSLGHWADVSLNHPQGALHFAPQGALVSAPRLPVSATGCGKLRHPTGPGNQEPSHPN